MNSDNFLYEYWKDEDVNEYVREVEIAKAEEKAEKKGFDDGFDNASNEYIKNMLLNGADLKFISKVSGKSTKEIKSLKKQMTI